jgi:hypothetical protein
MRIRKRTLRWAGVLLGLAVTGLLIGWAFLDRLSSAEQRRLEAALVGKTMEDVGRSVGREPYLFVPKHEWARQLPAFQPQSDEDAALGYWEVGPAETDGVVRVTFDQKGIATRVWYRPFPGPIERACAWLRP